MEIQALYALFAATALGALVGIERELSHSHEKSTAPYEGFGGIRSYALIALSGAVCAWIDTKMGGHAVVIAGLATTAALIAISHAYSSFARNDIGVTSEFAAIVVFLLGIVVSMGHLGLAFVMTIGLMTILSSKDSFRSFRSKISKEEFGNAMKFAVVAFVVLPLLPNEKFSFMEAASSLWFASSFDFRIWKMEFFNPYGIWFFVVVMSAVEFAGYVLSKFLGTKGGILASGAVGGLVSSTAVTAAMTSKSLDDKKNAASYVVATLVASCIMLVRVVLIVTFLSPGLLPTVLLPASLMFAALFAASGFFFYRSLEKKTVDVHVGEKLESPFRILPAIKFAAFIVVIKFVSAAGVAYKDVMDPQFLYYGLGLVSGLADVDAISLDMAWKFTDGAITAKIAATTVLIAVMANNLVKASLAYRFWEKSFGRMVASSFWASMAAGIVGIALLSQ